MVGVVVAETSWLTRGWLPPLGALLGGQGVGHFTLATSASGHALDHSAAVRWRMILAHLAAAVVCAALIRAATSPNVPGLVIELWRRAAAIDA